MRIQILSDLHLEFAGISIPDAKADVVVLAGDTHLGLKGIRWAAESFPRSEVVYICGNHEYYKQAYPKLLGKLRSESESLGIHFLENETVTLGDVTFAGCTLWTDFRLNGDQRLNGAAAHHVMSDFRAIKCSPQYRRLRPEDTVAIHRRSRHWLQSKLDGEHTGSTVVVTHHAPCPRSLDPNDLQDPISAAYCSDLTPLIEETGPALWIHGHTHRSVDYHVGRTRIVSNPRGYPDEPVSGFAPDFVVELADG